jgi:hypothetical protein
MDQLAPRDRSEHFVRPRLVVGITWVISDVVKGAICDFGNASSHKVVKVE